MSTALPPPPNPLVETSIELAYRRLGVKMETVLIGPQISPQLRVITKNIRRAGQPRQLEKRTVVETDTVDGQQEGEQRVTITRHEHYTELPPPYGPGSDLVTSWPNYLQASSERDAIAVLTAYRSLPHYLAKILPIEAFCAAVGVNPIRILGILTATIVEMGTHASTIIAAINQPRMVQKSIEMALTDEGIEDRKLQFAATRFLPSAKGAHTSINIQQNATANAKSASDSTAQAAAPTIVEAPHPEQTVRRFVDRFNEHSAATLARREPAQLEAQVVEPVHSPVIAPIQQLEAELDEQ